ncbi:hypothetical protein BS636_13290 [Acinetobacter sp. LoGeW2-3]|uniref:hypothetical protein n=1 Tax=Acinetobacter sp. LoGeW2-3 TaxID=1808001 RepID=UPI000C05AA69|nr:hypothetical protein [Acinetobacter sp. LoGeW2-3]ATO20574.1 hypothetical protein BS636_13290 [Acinetobacter sp. LoGeW2-3]
MAYENNKHISILQSVKPATHRSPQFYLLSGFVLGVLSVGSVLLGYSYYQDHKEIITAQVKKENHQVADSNHAVENEQLIQKTNTPLGQENKQNSEDGFDQNIENMFKIAKPKSSSESKNRTSPFESTFGSQDQKPLIEVNDGIKSPKPEVHTFQSSTAKSKETKGSEKNLMKVKSATQPAVQIEGPLKLKTASTSSQDQSPAVTSWESAEIAQS